MMSTFAKNQLMLTMPLKKIGCLFLALPFLFLMSCSSYKSGVVKKFGKITIPTSLAHTAWQLDSIIDFKPEPKLQKPVTLIFDVARDHQVSGFGGCNYFGGKYEQDGSALHFSQLLSTKKYCLIGSSTETHFTATLLNCKKAGMDKAGRLLLMDGDKVLAIFEKTAFPQSKN